MPASRDAFGYGFRLGASSLGQGKIGATAKSRRLDAFDVSMTGKENLCHAQPQLNARYRGLACTRS
jgi:hypothetical protein